MKTNIYDWPDLYNDILESMLRFAIEHVSIHNMGDALLPMEVHSVRLIGHDFNKRYDMTKTYRYVVTKRKTRKTLCRRGHKRKLQENGKWYFT